MKTGIVLLEITAMDLEYEELYIATGTGRGLWLSFESVLDRIVCLKSGEVFEINKVNETILARKLEQVYFKCKYKVRKKDVICRINNSNVMFHNNILDFPEGAVVP